MVLQHCCPTSAVAIPERVRFVSRTAADGRPAPADTRDAGPAILTSQKVQVRHGHRPAHNGHTVANQEALSPRRSAEAAETGHRVHAGPRLMVGGTHHATRENLGALSVLLRVLCD